MRKAATSVAKYSLHHRSAAFSFCPSLNNININQEQQEQQERKQRGPRLSGYLSERYHSPNHLFGLSLWMSLLRRRALLVGVVVLALHGILVTAWAPVILIPGFMSSRLLAWKHKSCDTFDINVGDRVWLDVTHVVYDSFRVCIIRSHSSLTHERTNE